MKRSDTAFYWLTLWIFGVVEPSFAEQKRSLRQVMSGYDFQSDNTQAMQNDDFANPGMLWVDQGKALFDKYPKPKAPACTQCHQTDTQSSQITTQPPKTTKVTTPAQIPLAGAATRYPQFDISSNKLINLEQRINRCRTQYQQQPAWPYESQPLLSITAFVAHLSKGMPFHAAIDGKAQPFFEQGKQYYYQRRGQMNLACHQCHEQHYGKKLRGDTLSQGHSNGYPIYRLEWQTLGSLHRRLRFCNQGIRAEPFAFGSEVYVNLELFLAWRAQQLPLETPAVRR